ncbi:TPA: DUF551 domain-containing protein [Enterobacter hormaechei subsp. xiangfangensis]|nr:DUF551 domain-containing protein [Enterobacter hormaechei subsp. xiangfangensis]HCM9384169.1 DUF551 domain-containing protein [Enterobacter hormaechei subsp. xiangfangensis]HCM9694246.1 DUF551 domain-containing protein [Enterobacter hormaechei subsp. xiangfangensis]
MSTLTKEWLQLRIAELEAERDATPGAVNEDAAKALAAMKLALASIEAEPAQEWTNEQCLEFLSIAFRHAEIKGDLELDDIRLGVKMANGSRAAMLQGAEPVSNRDELPDGWVACSERMPEDEQEVITHNIFGYRHVSFFDEHSGNFFNRLDGSPVDCVEHVLVSHWMPLPAAPQQEVK